MTTMAEVNTAIRGALEDVTTGWAARHPTVPLMYVGDDFDPPDQGDWARVTVLGGLPSQVEFGLYRRFRRPGIIRVQFWLVTGLGSGQVYDYADSIKEILEGDTSTGVRFFNTGLPVEEAVEGTWHRWRTDTNFDADELRQV
jgi:hypothetical protein